MEPDFDALADGARSAVNKTGEHTLWKAVMALPAWYFVGDRAGDEAEPLVAAVDGEPHLLAFTDPERAGAFSRYRAAQRGGEGAGSVRAGPEPGERGAGEGIPDGRAGEAGDQGAG